MSALSNRTTGCRIHQYNAKGYRLVTLENALIRVSVLVSKGADIIEFRFKPFDTDVLWHSHRAYPDLDTFIPETSAGWDSFFDFFIGGWQESFPTGNTTGTHRLGNGTLHGEVSVLPWEYSVVEDSEDRISVKFAVECRRTPFRLERTMTLSKEAACVSIEETISNLSSLDLEYAWGHHPAFGAPLLSANAVLDLPEGTVSTREPLEISQPRLAPGKQWNSKKASGANGEEIDLSQAPPPDLGTWDNFEVKLSPEAEGLVAIRNPDLGFGFGLKWDREVFPYLWEWEVCGGWPNYPLWGREYLVALEPFNCPLGGGLHSLGGKALLPKIGPNETRTSKIEAGICLGSKVFSGSFVKSSQLRVHLG
jgi:galactose mutarotase-like enzyme